MTVSLADPIEAHLSLLVERVEAIQAQADRVRLADTYPSIDQVAELALLLDLIAEVQS